MYTASVQQIGRTFRDKGEKDGYEVGTRANKNTYLYASLYKPNNTKTNKTQTYNKHLISTKTQGVPPLERAVTKILLGSLNRLKVHQTSLLKTSRDFMHAYIWWSNEGGFLRMTKNICKLSRFAPGIENISCIWSTPESDKN